MSRRSHHPARRHGRPHGEPRAPRPGGAADAAPAQPVGAPLAGDADELQAQVSPPRTPPSDAPAPEATPPEEPPRDPAPADEPPGGGRSVIDPRPIELGAAEPVPAERSLVVAPVPGLPARATALQAGPAPQRGPAGAGRPAAPPPAGNGNGDVERNACTAPQLRRFIKSRAYVPMHELRRRFGIEGDDDDVTAVNMGSGSQVFVGLPEREGLLLGELLKSRDVGYELSLDPISPIVVGVFPMRPIPRS